MKYEKVKSDEIHIPFSAPVTVTEMGNITEVQYMSRLNQEARTIKLSDDEYMVVETGEVKEYGKKSDTRNESKNSIRKTMKRIRQLVQTNITDIKNIRWVTLTYRENMTDTKRLYDDFRKFNQRFCHHLISCGMEKPEYIAVAEPQQRGAWHLHVLYIWNHPAPYINNDAFAKLWKHGFTKTKALKDNNIANYLISYLTDLDIAPELKDYFPENILKETDGNQNKKSIVKGMRLNLYPANFNIVRCSRNIKKPQKRIMTYKDALALVSQKRLSYQTTFRMSDEKGFSSIVDKKEYITISK